MAPLKEVIREEYRQFRELSSLFFGRFLDNDLISLDGDTRAALAGVLGLLAAPGLFISFFEFVHFSSAPLCFLPLFVRDLASFPDKTLHLSLSMAVLGIVTVIEWDAILPDRRDYAVLRPLPVRMRTLFAAKIVSLLRFWAIFTLILNAISFVFFPMTVVQKGSFETLSWFIRCHVVALVAGNLFMFLAMIALQGVLLILAGWRGYRRLAPYVQSGLVALLLLMFFSSIGVAYGVRPGQPASALMLSLPPVWFAGLYQNELGWTQGVFRDLAARAWWALWLATGVGGAAYALSYKRSVAKSFEEQESKAGAPGSLKRVFVAGLDRFLLRSPAQRAAFHFVWNTIVRSRSHRVLVAAYAGAGFALVFQSLVGVMASGGRTWWQSPRGPLLPAMLVLSLFLLYGLRYAFAMPAELRANWLFRVAAGSDPNEYMAGVRKAVILIAIAPLASVFLPVHAIIWGWRTGALHVAYGATVAWLLMEALLAGLDKLPFTCSYVPGKANLKASWPLYVIGYLVYVSVFSGIELLILDEPRRFIAFAVCAVLAKRGLDAYRRNQEELALIYDERPEPAVRTLGLDGGTA